MTNTWTRIYGRVARQRTQHRSQAYAVGPGKVVGDRARHPGDGAAEDEQARCIRTVDDCAVAVDEQRLDLPCPLVAVPACAHHSLLHRAAQWDRALMAMAHSPGIYFARAKPARSDEPDQVTEGVLRVRNTHPVERPHGGARLGVLVAWQRREHDPSRLGLPPRVHHRASAIADDVVVPEP